MKNGDSNNPENSSLEEAARPLEGACAVRSNGRLRLDVAELLRFLRRQGLLRLELLLQLEAQPRHRRRIFSVARQQRGDHRVDDTDHQVHYREAAEASKPVFGLTQLRTPVNNFE